MAYINGNEILFSPQLVLSNGYDKGYKDGQLATLKESRYMNGKESGTIVSVNDVTPIEHNVGVKVESKNLVDFNSIVTYTDATECVTDGASFTARGNEGEYAYQYAAGQIAFPKYTGNNLVTNGIPLKKGITYTVSFDYLLIEQGKYDSDIKLILYNSALTQILFTASFGGVVGTTKRCSHSFTIPEDDNTGFCFRINNNYVTISNMQLELGDTASPYTPYVDDLTGVEVARYGGNLIDCNSIVSHNNDVSADFVAGDNSFTIRGNEGTDNLAYNTGQLMFPFGNVNNITKFGIPVKQGITYTVSFDYLLLEQGKWDNRIEAIIYTDTLGIENNKNFGGTLGKIERYSITFTASKDEKVGLSFRANNNYVNISNIILAVGEQTKYEPYKEPITYTANADGTVEGVKSISPNMTLIPNNNAVTVECEYLRDIDLYIDNLLKSVAMIGGE